MNDTNEAGGNGLAKDADKPMNTMLDLFEVRNDRALTPSDRPPASEAESDRKDDVVSPTPSHRRLWSSEELS